MSAAKSTAKKLAREMRLVQAVRAQIPGALISGTVRPSAFAPHLLEVTAARSARDMDAECVRRIVHRGVCEVNGEAGRPSLGAPRWSCAPALGPSDAATLSPSGALSVTFKTESGSKPGAKARRFLTVVDTATQSLVRSIEVTSVHGAFVADDDFGGVSWTANEQALVYVADRNPPKRSSTDRGGWAHAEQESWGELTGGMSRPSIFVVSMASGRVAQVPTDIPASADMKAAFADRDAALATLRLVEPKPGSASKTSKADGSKKDGSETSADPSAAKPLPTSARHEGPVAAEELSCGQPQVGGSAGDEWLVYSAVSPLPVRLGSTYCMNRPWSVWALPLSGALSALHLPLPEDKADDVIGTDDKEAGAAGAGDADSVAAGAAGAAGSLGSGDASGESAVDPSDFVAALPYIARLSDSRRWCRSARISASGDVIVWLQTPHIMTHGAASSLARISWTDVAAAVHKAGTDAARDAAAELQLARETAVAKAAGASGKAMDEDSGKLPEGFANAWVDASAICLAELAELVPRMAAPCYGGVERAEPPEDVDGRVFKSPSKTDRTGSALGSAAFAGIYTNSLPRRTLTADGRWMLLTAQDGFDQALIRVRLASDPDDEELPGTVHRCSANPSETPHTSWTSGSARNPCEGFTLLDLAALPPVDERSGSAGDVALVSGGTLTSPDALGLVLAGGASGRKRGADAASSTAAAPAAAAAAAAAAAVGAGSGSAGFGVDGAVWHPVWSPAEGNLPDEAATWPRGAGVSNRPRDEVVSGGGSAEYSEGSVSSSVAAARGAVSPSVVWPGGVAAAFPMTMALPAATRTAGGGRISVTADDVDVASVIRNSTTTIIPLWRRCLPLSRSADEGALPMAELPGTDGVASSGEGSADFNADAAMVEVAVVMPGADVPVPERRGSTNGGETASKAVRRPVVLLLHGGPHSALPGLLSPTVVSMLAEGYGLVFVNYRGSLGYGERSVNSLPGACGRRDVEDCELALRVAVEASAAAAAATSSGVALPGWSGPLTAVRLGGERSGGSGSAGDELDASRVVAWGGSHGGFLGAHLIAGRGSVAAACLRNPVVDVAAMASATDIPEWCVAEGAGAMMDPSQRWCTPDVAAAMHASSPLYALRRGGAPTLVGIGSKDLRVPPFNGYILHNALRGQGVPSRLLVYPDDSHPMSSFGADVDFCVNGLVWIRHFV